MSEIEPSARAVLKHHYPETKLHGDFTTIQQGDYEPIDVLVGGTPCQSFSVAGLRGGLSDDRGNLALEYLRLAERLRPRFVVWENVPGVLSSLSHDAPDPCQPPDDLEEGSEWVGEDEYDADESHAFACFLAGLSALGYGWAYRIYDAQYFELAQRRERVFVVGCLGDRTRPSEILSLREGLRWHPAPGRTTGETVAGAIAARSFDGGAGGRPEGAAAGHFQVANPLGSKRDGGWRGDLDNDTYAIQERAGASAYRTSGNCGAWNTDDRTDALNTGTDRTSHLIAHSLRADGFDASEDGTGRGTPLVTVGFQSNAGGQNGEVYDDLSPAIKAQANGGNGMQAVAFQNRFRGDDGRGYDRAPPSSDEMTGALETVKPWNIAGPGVVRRLTPLECCRLQGFKDDYFDGVLYRGKPLADGPRYRLLGNSMAVPVMAHIGRRIAEVEDAA